jgi:hypothetical protein
MRYSNRSRRGRALFVFAIGIGLIVLASGFFVLRAAGSTRVVGVGSAISMLACAMLFVATGSLLPTIEDWFGARHELRIIDPLLQQLDRRQPDVGIGVRPHGPLAFRVAERMSLISDALFLEADKAARGPAAARKPDAAAKAAQPVADAGAPPASPAEQARAIAQWIRGSGPKGNRETGFPGFGWLRQPDNYSDREWILEIAQQYRNLTLGAHRPAAEGRSAELRRMAG